MTVHLVKLCVGVNDVSALKHHIFCKIQSAERSGTPIRITHTTRMFPRRNDELLRGGSLYWVINGSIQARQKLLEISSFTDVDGVKRCDLVLSPELILTYSQPRRAFQGWRYLSADDAPEDLNSFSENQSIDPIMLAELKELCLI